MASDEDPESLEAEPGDFAAGGDGVVAEGFEEHGFAGARRPADDEVLTPDDPFKGA